MTRKLKGDEIFDAYAVVACVDQLSVALYMRWGVHVGSVSFGVGGGL